MEDQSSPERRTYFRGSTGPPDYVKWTLTIQECRLHLVYSDLTALITGPNAGNFPFYARRRPISTRIPPRPTGGNRIANSPSSITRPAMPCRRFLNGAITISST